MSARDILDIPLFLFDLSFRLFFSRFKIVRLFEHARQ